MPVLKSLSFTALPKTGNDPVLARRAKFATKLEEQKLLLAYGFLRKVPSVSERPHRSLSRIVY